MNKPHVWDVVEDKNLSYCPTIMANGALCTLLDYHGDQQQGIKYSTYGKFSNYKQMPAAVYRAGVRRGTVKRDLVCLGHFEEKVNGVWEEPEHSRQIMDVGEGTVECLNTYKKGVKVRTFTFVHKKESVWAIRKELTGVSSYEWKYSFSEEYTPEQLNWSNFRAKKNPGGKSANATWSVAGVHGDVCGTINIQCSVAADITVAGHEITFRFDKPEKIDFLISYTDTIYEGEKEKEEAKKLSKRAQRNGFDGLLATQRKLWEEYWKPFTLELPDKKMQSTFESSLYVLECSSTKWLIPVAINNGAWCGGYFGFNLFTELFLTTGHKAEAFKIPTFRNTLTRTTTGRVSKYDEGLRYIWISDEDGLYDMARPGIWSDHFLHMYHVAEECYNCYLYTRDKAFLEKTSYPVMRGIANFILYQLVYYTKDGKAIIGSSCDLERLGRLVKNGMLGTCGAIGALEWAAEAAAVLCKEPELAAKWRKAALDLRAGLPNDGEKYIPYGGCDKETKNIGSLGGLYPYPVLTKKDALEQAAIDDFIKDTSAGNMYRVGSGLCTWYADWVAIAMFRSDRTLEGIEFMKQAMDMTGAFNAVFEINEPGEFVSFPWCSAPNASFVQAVIEMLMWYEDDVLHLMSEYPADWKDIKFDFHAPDDLFIHFERKNGEIVNLTVDAGRASTGSMKKIVLGDKEFKLHLVPGRSKKLI